MKAKLEKARSLIGVPKTPKKPTVQHKNHVLLDILAQGRDPGLTCGHFLLGSSDIFGFITGKYKFRYIHSRLMTRRKNKATGVIGERAYYLSTMNYHSQLPGKKPRTMLIEPICRLPEFPLVLAVPDFHYRFSNETMIIEVKTSGTGSTPQDIPNRTIVQIWIAMDSFMVETAELIFYELIDVKSQEVQQTRSILITKKCRFFDKVHFRKMMPNVSGFIMTFLKFNCVKANKNDRKYFESKLIEQFDKPIPVTKDYLNRYLMTDNMRDNCKPLAMFVYPWSKCFENLEKFPCWTRKNKTFPETWKERQAVKEGLLKKAIKNPTVTGEPPALERIEFNSDLRVLLFEKSGDYVEEIDEDRLSIFQDSVKVINQTSNFQSDQLNVDPPDFPKLLCELVKRVEQLEAELKDTKQQNKHFLKRFEDLERTFKTEHEQNKEAIKRLEVLVSRNIFDVTNEGSMSSDYLNY